MTNQEINAKVKDVIAAPSCNADLKAAAENYLKAQEALLKSLEENVCSIDELIALCESDTGKQFFGAEKAAGMAKTAHECKAKGEKFCICPACQAGHVVYEELKK